MIEETQRPMIPEMHGSIEKAKPLPFADKQSDLARAKELDFVCKNRKREIKRPTITKAIETCTVCELMFRPAQRAVHMRKLEEQSFLLGAGVAPGEHIV